MKKNSTFYIFCIVIFIFYSVIPFFKWFADDSLRHFFLLSEMAFISVVAMIFSYVLPLYDVYLLNIRRVNISKFIFIWLIPFVFFIFVFYTIYTAPSIPILSALAGATHELLSEERGAFLKGRTGMDAYLIYVSTVFVNTIIPYTLIFLFAIKARHRLALFAVFFLYSVAFLQKALFLNVLLPLLFYFFLVGELKFASALKVLVISILLLLIFIAGTTENVAVSSLDGSMFLTAQYIPSGAFEFFMWRALAVPIFTATDTLEVHSELFSDNLLLGATSSIISAIFSLERINIERHVFEFQFGGWNDVANANAVFFIDGYVNFGWLGVVFYSFVVGQIFRVLMKTRDKALSSISILFAMGAFSGSLLGILFSNGWVLVLIFAMFLKNKTIENMSLQKMEIK